MVITRNVYVWKTLRDVSLLHYRTNKKTYFCIMSSVLDLLKASFQGKSNGILNSAFVKYFCNKVKLTNESN